jgi:alpha-ketoglutarate-dependent taurine dioxygenase
MTPSKPVKQEAKVLPATRRKKVGLSSGALVKTGYLLERPSIPLVIEPAVEDLRLTDWSAGNRAYLEKEILQFGSILFRGFQPNDPSEFERVIESVSGRAIEYRERSSPRSRVSGNIYTSTDYPADRSIFPHNEHSYSRTFPLRIFFCCLIPATWGGETPIGDCRKILNRISPSIRQRFVKKDWMYVRNFWDGFGLPWQKVFQTTDRGEVQRYCAEKDIQCEWRDGGRLRTRQVRPALAKHPRTGEDVWFNHATFFHVSTLEPPVREALLNGFKEEDLPNNTYYGDGSPIEPEVLDELRGAYLEEAVAFTWQKGDLLMADNMLTAHARLPYKGERQVLVGMAEPFTRQPE